MSICVESDRNLNYNGSRGSLDTHKFLAYYQPPHPFWGKSLKLYVNDLWWENRHAHKLIHELRLKNDCALNVYLQKARDSYSPICRIFQSVSGESTSVWLLWMFILQFSCTYTTRAILCKELNHCCPQTSVYKKGQVNGNIFACVRSSKQNTLFTRDEYLKAFLKILMHIYMYLTAVSRWEACSRNEARGQQQDTQIGTVKICILYRENIFFRI